MSAILLSCLFACGKAPIVAPSQLPSPTTSEPSAPVLVQADGSYPTKALEKENITLKVIQSAANPIKKPEEGKAIIQKNLEHVLQLGQQACSEGEKPDILLFHEFPLTGYVYGNRENKLNFALEIPGPESDAFAKLARECDTYVIFGAYVKDADWPQHIFTETCTFGSC